MSSNKPGHSSAQNEHLFGQATQYNRSRQRRLVQTCCGNCECASPQELTAIDCQLLTVLCLLNYLCAKLYASAAVQVADCLPVAWAACRSSKIAVTYRRASRAGKQPTQPPSHPSSRRLREFVHKYRGSYATCSFDTQSDPGPCQFQAARPD